MFTKEQLTSAVRWAITLLAGLIGGWFAAKGWLTSDQVTSALTSETVISLVVAGITLLFGQLGRTTGGLIKSAADQPGVTVVAPPAVANSIASPDVVSSAENKIVHK